MDNVAFARQQQRVRNVRAVASENVTAGCYWLLLSLCAGEQWIAPGDWLSARGAPVSGRSPSTLAVLLVGAALWRYLAAPYGALFENPRFQTSLLGTRFE